MASFGEEDEEKALAALIGELNAASELTTGKRLVPGRIPGFYEELASTGEGRPKMGNTDFVYGSRGGKKKRRRTIRGGGICEDNVYVRLAIDSAIILAAAAAVVGTGYAGYTVLADYMGVYRLSPLVVACVKSLYDILSTTGTSLVQIGSRAIDTAKPIAQLTWEGIKGIGAVGSRLTSAAASVTPTVVKFLYTVAPGIAIGRYFGTVYSAREDAQSIIDTVSQKYASSRQYVSQLVTSITTKKAQITSTIARTRASGEAIVEKVVQIKTDTVVAAGIAAEQGNCIKNQIRGVVCGIIDRGVSLVDVAGALTEGIDGIDIGEQGSCSIMGGKRRTRRTKRVRRTRRTRKNKRTRRHH